MLNKNNERELAYFARVTNIAPMDAERLECIYINGWNCVVGKGEFKVGDLGVFFEPDSKLPDVEPFVNIEFLKKKDYKIKPQKIRGVVSQGLFMPLSAFGWVIDDAGTIIVPPSEQFGKSMSFEEHDFLTEYLKVTYAVTEDNQRKASSADKYKKMAQRRPSIFKKKWARWMMKREWGRKVMFMLFGKKKDKKNGWPDWVVKTDEERCLAGNTFIDTDEGRKRIADIVNHKLPVKVASINPHTKQVEYKTIRSYQKYESDQSDMVVLKYPMTSGAAKRFSTLSCTADHKIFTDHGWVVAADLKAGDTVYLRETTYEDPEVLEYLYGNILGDGHIYKEGTRVRFGFRQGEKNAEYVRTLSNLYDASCYFTEKNGFNPEKINHRLLISDTALLSNSINADNIFVSNNKWNLNQKFLDKITEKSLATWFMDDGSNHIDENDQSHVFFHTESYSASEQKLLIEMFEKNFHLKATLQGLSEKSKYQYLRLSNESAERFLNLVAPYIVPCLKYKLPERLRDVECCILNKQFKKINTIVPVQLVNVSAGKKVKRVYDLEIEDNHNFFANHILTHNCQNLPQLFPSCDTEWIATEKIDGTSTTFTMKGFGKKREFYVCSRNVVFDKPDKKCFYETNVYTEMAEKYKMEEVLADMLEAAHVSDKNVSFVTVQGETYGGTIQKRNYGDEHRLAVFNVIYGYTDGHTVRLNPVAGKSEMERYDIPYVPIVDTAFKLPSTCDELLKLAHGTSAIDGQLREGLVFRSTDGVRSFKAVDPEFLVKYHV